MPSRTDIAQRVYDHTWKLDPIMRSLLDTDFYKLLMLQMIWGVYPKVDATFQLINRATKYRLAEEIDIDELREQLDHARTVRFGKKEMIWLAGNTFYGRKQIFQARLSRLAGRFSAARIRTVAQGRPVRTDLPRQVDGNVDVGDPRADHHQRIAFALCDEKPRTLLARRSLCAGKGEALGQGRAAEGIAGPAYFRLSARAAATPICGSAGASKP
jgi:hypothetical protein